MEDESENPAEERGTEVHFFRVKSTKRQNSLLQGIFPTQGSNPGLLRCRQVLYCLSHQGVKGTGHLSCLPLPRYLIDEVILRPNPAAETDLCQGVGTKAHKESSACGWRLSGRAPFLVVVACFTGGVCVCVCAQSLSCG